VYKHTRWLSAAAALILVFVFTLTPARTLAGRFLSIFRAEHVKIVDLSETDFQQLQQMLAQFDSLQVEQLGEFRMENEGIYQRYESVSAAAADTSFNLTLPEVLDSSPAENIYQQPAQVLHYTPDVDQVNHLLAEMGSTKLLPPELDGQTISFHLGPIVQAAYTIDGNYLTLMQAPPPSVSGTEGVETDALWDALAGIPVLPEQVRAVLEQDPLKATTFLFPRIEGINDGELVVINGSEGVFFTFAESSGENFLLWPQGDHWNLMASFLSKDKMLSLAEQVN